MKVQKREEKGGKKSSIIVDVVLIHEGREKKWMHVGGSAEVQW
jgi:hypothetical protein